MILLSHQLLSIRLLQVLDALVLGLLLALTKEVQSTGLDLPLRFGQPLQEVVWQADLCLVLNLLLASRGHIRLLENLALGVKSGDDRKQPVRIRGVGGVDTHWLAVF